MVWQKIQAPLYFYMISKSLTLVGILKFISVTRLIHANFGINRLKSLRATAASVKHKYYAKNTINCHLKL